VSKWGLIIQLYYNLIFWKEIWNIQFGPLSASSFQHKGSKGPEPVASKVLFAELFWAIKTIGFKKFDSCFLLHVCWKMMKLWQEFVHTYYWKGLQIHTWLWTAGRTMILYAPIPLDQASLVIECLWFKVWGFTVLHFRVLGFRVLRFVCVWGFQGFGF
jgi:hypothetical protein